MQAILSLLPKLSNPALNNLLPLLGIPYIIQAGAAIPSIIAQTELFYDLSGSLTFLATAAASLYLPALRAGTPLPSLFSLHPRKLILTGMMSFWTARLGYTLFARAWKSGGDSRFDEMKKQPVKFAGAFFVQATWVAVMAAPILALNVVPCAALGPLNWIDAVGAAVWIAGIGFEIVADRQKAQWKKEKDEKKHHEEFIQRGLWAKSRHPNYFGEIVLWNGIAIMAAHSLAALPAYYPAWAGLVAFTSPAFITLLLTQVSGIPIQEKANDKKFGNRKDYQDYKKNTPVLIPKL